MSFIKIPAIRFSQNGNQLFSFVINGKKIPLFASISRIKKNEEQVLVGYQRPQVLSHITEIRQYLESDHAMIPNAIVIAFDDRVIFTPNAGGNSEGDSCLGHLKVPVDADTEDQPKSGWIVDGQQRMTAIQEADISSFPICIVGFIARDERAQREHFIRVNSAKPLPKDLIDELIPETDAVLDSMKEKRKFPLKLRNELNQDVGSPFFGRIRTPTVPNGYIASSSVLKMLDNSLSNGVLFRHRRVASDDVATMIAILSNFWKAVHQTFGEAWELPPTKSRLTHGAGIISLGLLMDAICDRLAKSKIPDTKQFANELLILKPFCAWTSGQWELGPGVSRKWNELQNIPRDIELLAHYLLSRYQAESSAPRGAP